MKNSTLFVIASPLLLAVGCAHHERQACFEEPSYAPAAAAPPVEPGVMASEPQNFEVLLRVHHTLVNDPSTAPLMPSLTVSESKGAVTLAGKVDSEAQKNMIETLVRQTPGVVSVADDIEVSGSGLAENNPDRSLTPTSRDQNDQAADGAGAAMDETFSSTGTEKSDSSQPSGGQTGSVTVNFQGSSDSDRMLAQQISQELRADASLASAISQVGISVNDGRVTLQGTVKNEVQKREIESAIERATGVSSVDNQLRVSASPGAPENP